ncbi:MAG: acetamidase/formamidase family protein [Actinobacteria bacterium]|nr:acetamidase/formamidase family protein [Actinomycetota bacterium]
MSAAESRVDCELGEFSVSAAGDGPAIRRVIDNSHPPAATVDSGDVVAFRCPGLPLPPEATLADFEAFNTEQPHTIIGPVHVRGAEPGDTLVAEILAVRLGQSYGHTTVVRGFGLLGDEVPESFIHNFSWEEGATSVALCDGVEVPLDPFCGILGVMPAEPGPHTTLPPRANGGNIDIRHLVAGATLYLPVAVPGAGFFAGDGHGAQGDGEICISALETAVEAKIRLSVQKGRTIRQPHLSTAGPLNVDGSRGYYATTGIGPDLYECSREAVRGMVETLVSERGLLWREAYVLCSLAVDLKISEIVDAPNWVVSAYLPQSVFKD